MSDTTNEINDELYNETNFEAKDETNDETKVDKNETDDDDKKIKNPFVRFFFYCIWRSIIIGITVYEFVKYHWTKRVLNYKYKEKDFDVLVKKLTKVPEHLTIGVNEKKVNYTDLARIVKWSQKFGAKYISVYSNNKNLLSLEELEIHLLMYQKSAHNSSDYSLRKPTDDSNIKIPLKARPYIYLENIPICLFDRSDSHDSIVRAAKVLCVQPKPIEQDDITAFLKQTYEFPDPELLLTFGPQTKLYGYPIWQIRLTEIYFQKTHVGFGFGEFYNVMLRYSKCEQRFGK